MPAFRHVVMPTDRFNRVVAECVGALCPRTGLLLAYAAGYPCPLEKGKPLLVAATLSYVNPSPDLLRLYPTVYAVGPEA